MDNNAAYGIASLVGSAVQAIIALLTWLGIAPQDFRQKNSTGTTTPTKLSKPRRIISFLMVGYFITTALGFWLLFRRPAAAPLTSQRECPTVETTAGGAPDRTVSFPPRTPEQQSSDQLEARRLTLEYRVKYPGKVDEEAELKWINTRLAQEGIPFTITSVKVTRGTTQTRAEAPAPKSSSGVGIIGAHGETNLQDVTVSGFPTGIDLRPSQKADVKETKVYAPGTTATPAVPDNGAPH